MYLSFIRVLKQILIFCFLILLIYLTNPILISLKVFLSHFYYLNFNSNLIAINSYFKADLII